MKEKRVIQEALPFHLKGNREIQEDWATCILEKGIFTVSDGFGGGEADLSAAKIAGESLREFLEKEAGDLESTLPFVLRSYYSLPSNVLFNALVYANRKILELNKDKNIHEKGGASVIAALVDKDLTAIASVGSCSAWIFRNGESKEIVRPKSYGRLVDPFQSAERMEFGIPLAALGMVDDLEPEINEVRLQRGDWLLLQTDGVPPELRSFIQQTQLKQDVSRLTQLDTIGIKSLLQHNPISDNLAISIICF